MLADSREQELILATEKDGLLAFNGHGFRQIYPQDPDARGITSIRCRLASGHLLLRNQRSEACCSMTENNLTIFHPTLKNLYVTSLRWHWNSTLWVSTLSMVAFSTGMAVKRNRFGEEQGLPDRQVESTAVTGDKTYVGTVLGVAEFERGRFSRVLASGVFATALLPRRGQLFVGTEDQGVLSIPLEARRLNAASGGALELPEVRQLFVSDEAVYVLTRGALYRMGARGFGWQQVLQPGGTVLSDRNISTLAADHQRAASGWGISGSRPRYRLEPGSGMRAAHTENEHVFCVNRILPDDKNGTVDVATANGLVRFNGAGSQEQILTRADGLIADHVTDVAVLSGWPGPGHAGGIDIS